MKNHFSALPLKLKQFYQFLSLHSFLVGLFPVLMPSFLWKKGIGLTELSVFIAISGLGFVVALSSWETIHNRYSFKRLMIISFLLQIGLMSMFFFQGQFFFLIGLALLNGMTNCFFWITQRALFFETIEFGNSGRRFGNMQIFLALIINISIAIGVVLLEQVGFVGVYTVFFLVAMGAIIYYLLLKNPPTLTKDLVKAMPLGFKEVLFFSDRWRSEKVFWLDGLFLYLESYFWIISLFLIARESFLTLGFLIVSVAGILAIIFYFIKNLIDKMHSQIVYLASVILYAASWGLRAVVDEKLPLVYLFFLLVSITFFTSLFRLAYNKRFFDIAQQGSKHRYLFIKSYLSQIFIMLSFTAIAITSFLMEGSLLLLKYIYILAILLSAGYFFYRPREKFHLAHKRGYKNL
ncbi:MAG: MFS transporter [Bdellovibrionaceae bacterium]|nr:MFS transporter [Pseudobdellovibrionaceae bacterium]